MTDRIDLERAEILANVPAAASTKPMKPLLAGVGTGRMATAIRECLAARATFLAGGMDIEEVNRITGEGLRQVWQGRTEPWHSLCRWCLDTGWIVNQIADERAERAYGPGATRREAFKCRDCRYWQRQAEEAAKKQGESDAVGAAARGTRRTRR